MIIKCLIGSLRKDSYNRKIYNALKELAPSGTELLEVSIANLPVFNADNESPFPKTVSVFKKELEESDAIIFISPEYNRSIPGGLKNAIDWASRGDNSLKEKWCAVVGATNGRLGTAPMQMHLKSILLHLGMYIVPIPEAQISNVETLLDDSGALIDDKVKEILETLINSLTTKASTS